MNENLRPQGSPILKRLVIGAALAASAAAGCAAPTSEVRANLASTTDGMVGTNSLLNDGANMSEELPSELLVFGKKVEDALIQYWANPSIQSTKTLEDLYSEGNQLFKTYPNNSERIDHSLGKIALIIKKSIPVSQKAK